jgi:hypothetical protein
MSQTASEPGNRCSLQRPNGLAVAKDQHCGERTALEGVIDPLQGGTEKPIRELNSCLTLHLCQSTVRVWLKGVISAVPPHSG